MHKKKAGKLQTGNTFPKQYWLAVNGKPKTVNKLFINNLKILRNPHPTTVVPSKTSSGFTVYCLQQQSARLLFFDCIPSG